MNALTLRPPFLYGTAWKEDQTESLTRLALEQGFRGLDTANQRKHYFEAAAGQAVQQAIAEGITQRDALFLQSKYTFQGGQDDRLPYDPKASLTEQVNQSFESSLKHFNTDYLDSYLLHGPAQRGSWSESDQEVWQAMESLHQAGQVKRIGVSNVSADQLKQLWQTAKIKPAYVQNRCFAVKGWDRKIREFCHQNGIVYQGFSLLTANLAALNQADIFALSRGKQATLPQLVFAFALQLGILPLTGTSQAQHMQDDLAATSIRFSTAEINLLLALEQDPG